MNTIRRFEVYVVSLDPTVGSEISKARPCAVLSPHSMNEHLSTVIVAPLTQTIRRWPSRIVSRFAGVKGEVALDQMRAVDKRRLTKRLGVLNAGVQTAVLAALSEMFAP